jgi:hypothetical protein
VQHGKLPAKLAGKLFLWRLAPGNQPPGANATCAPHDVERPLEHGRIVADEQRLRRRHTCNEGQTQHRKFLRLGEARGNACR